VFLSKIFSSQSAARFLAAPVGNVKSFERHITYQAAIELFSRANPRSGAKQL
jgi:hypothetical protein